ncbi:MAG: hypothetical protein ACR2OJ_15885, partial [Hyphomicrobiales bacterium]
MRIEKRMLSAAGLGLGLSLMVTSAVQAEDIWVKVSNQDCMVWSDSALKDNEVLTWSGGCLDGRA